jgi:hypothetical protein
VKCILTKSILLTWPIELAISATDALRGGISVARDWTDFEACRDIYSLASFPMLVTIGDHFVDEACGLEV